MPPWLLPITAIPKFLYSTCLTTNINYIIISNKLNKQKLKYFKASYLSTCSFILQKKNKLAEKKAEVLKQKTEMYMYFKHM